MRTLRTAVAVLGLVSLSGCAFLTALLADVISRPTLHFERAELKNISFDGLTLGLHWRVDNPNDVGIKLASIGYGLTIDGHALARGENNRGLELAPNGSSQVELPLSVRFVDLGQALAALYQKREVPWGADGHFGFGTPAGVIKVPFQTQGKLPVPRLPRLHLAGARVTNLTLTGATLQVDVDVANQNNFPLPLGALDYRLQAAGRQVATGQTRPPSVAASQTGRITIPVRIDFARAGRALYDALRSGEVDLALDGTLGAGPLKMPVQLRRRVRF